MGMNSLAKPPPRRQSTSREIAAFVHGWAGQDTASPNRARLIVDLLREAHRRFKFACALADTKMNDEIRLFIERCSAELENSQGLQSRQGRLDPSDQTRNRTQLLRDRI